jgi:hypothetical protein
VECGGDVIEGVVGQGAPDRIAILLEQPAEGGEGLDGLHGFILRIVGNAHSVWPLVQGKGRLGTFWSIHRCQSSGGWPSCRSWSGTSQNQPATRVGRGGYSCETDDVAQFAVATILGVVTIMAMPEIAGVLAGGAALSYSLGYSIMGEITCGAGHRLVC